MPYTVYQSDGERLAVGLCPCGDRLAMAIADPNGHPFDLEPATLDAETIEQIRDGMTEWLAGRRS